jgi:hypothetical protein
VLGGKQGEIELERKFSERNLEFRIELRREITPMFLAR